MGKNLKEVEAKKKDKQLSINEL